MHTQRKQRGWATLSVFENEFFLVNVRFLQFHSIFFYFVTISDRQTMGKAIFHLFLIGIVATKTCNGQGVLSCYSGVAVDIVETKSMPDNIETETECLTCMVCHILKKTSIK